jgi:hypothetical protein
VEAPADAAAAADDEDEDDEASTQQRLFEAEPVPVAATAVMHSVVDAFWDVAGADAMQDWDALAAALVADGGDGGGVDRDVDKPLLLALLAASMSRLAESGSAAASRALMKLSGAVGKHLQDILVMFQTEPAAVRCRAVCRHSLSHTLTHTHAHVLYLPLIVMLASSVIRCSCCKCSSSASTWTCTCSTCRRFCDRSTVSPVA